MFKVKDFNIEFGFKHIRGVNFEVREDRLVTDVTICNLNVADKGFEGLASCVAGDAFNKEVGRKLALTRALEDSGLSKGIRAAVWEEYFGRGE